jgi:uncharacterized CHY-type Zn-finger protein
MEPSFDCSSIVANRPMRSLRFGLSTACPRLAALRRSATLFRLHLDPCCIVTAALLLERCGQSNNERGSQICLGPCAKYLLACFCVSGLQQHSAERTSTSSDSRGCIVCHARRRDFHLYKWAGMCTKCPARGFQRGQVIGIWQHDAADSIRDTAAPCMMTVQISSAPSKTPAQHNCSPALCRRS